MNVVLAVDDDPAILHLITRSLLGLEVVTATDGDAALAQLEDHSPEVVLLDIVLEGESGLDLFRRIRQLDARLPVIFITSEDSSQTAIEALQLGAYDYVTKPIDVKNLRRVVDEAAETRRRMSVGVALPTGDSDEAPAGDVDVLIGRSSGMMEVYRGIARCAKQDVPVLIRGESGTGKELVARAIYQNGSRADRPFLAVNCAALTENLLESELFGYEKGAFTGATTRRIGKFEQCDGGTIFLDEVGDMSLAVQSKVLRLLQQQEFQRLGGHETIRTDVRIISATNRPLEAMCADKAFREDLFFRLNGYPMRLPPLRDRGDDRKVLLEHFVATISRSLGMKGFQGVAPDALALLLNYQWPGNIREMQAIVRQALLDTRGPVLVPAFLPRRVLHGHEASSNDSQASSKLQLDEFVERRLGSSDDLYAETVEFVEKFLLERVLRQTRGNQSRAAEILGITRGKLRNRIKTFGMDLEELAEEEA
ncbi:MAG: sigma-54-dependent Fis family transcriptional regulator [Planctomycetes bacterium]|nr:sigma-54-dependent Fis family transcriptional regulator [Planctomycetota bacterium]